MTYYRMHWYLVQIDPPNQAHLYRALLHQDSMMYYRMHWYLVPIDHPPLIEPTCTEPYYTRTV